jgi:putative nucleotidyltransferase with HDIG domain
MMVCKIAELSGYDKVVQIAALLHDIGKPASRKINPKNNHVQFFGHELLSAEMAADVLDLMIKEGMLNVHEKQIITQLILHHAFLYKHPDIDTMMAHFNNDKTFCTYLVELIRCDALGRFCYDLSDEKKFQDLFEQINGLFL